MGSKLSGCHVHGFRDVLISLWSPSPSLQTLRTSVDPGAGCLSHFGHVHKPDLVPPTILRNPPMNSYAHEL